jgi:hypothetical protein
MASELRQVCVDDDPSAADLANVRQHAADTVGEFLQWEIASRKIADRYYAGTGPVFPAHTRLLAESLQSAEQVVRLFNDHLDYLAWLRTEGTRRVKGTRRKLPPLPIEPIDLDGLRAAITPAGVELARHIVVMAQAEAAEFLGETRQALALVRAHLWLSAR